MIAKIPEQLSTQVVLWVFFYFIYLFYSFIYLFAAFSNTMEIRNKAKQDSKTFCSVRKETSLKLGLEKLVAKKISTMRK